MSTIRFFVVGILCVFVAAGCSYTTVTGEVVDLKGVPVEGAVIKLYHTEKKKVLTSSEPGNDGIHLWAVAKMLISLVQVSPL